MKKIVLLFMVLALVTSCGGSGGETIPDPTGEPVTIVDGTLANTSFLGDSFSLASSSLSGDTLTLEVTYGGGCVTHTFALKISNVFLESFPVQVEAMLDHDAGGDMCDAFISRTLVFDISGIKTTYQDTYNAQSGSIVLTFPLFPGHSVRYDF